MTIDPDRQYTATLKTEKGDIVIELFAKDAPVTVNNFVFLAQDGFYDNTTFHRVIPGFMAQGGDPLGTGTGGPGYRFNDEPSEKKHVTGAISMANSGANTNGSQFFITYAPQPHLDTINPDGSPKNCASPSVSCHTVFGRVVEGMSVVESISTRNPSTATNPGDRIVSISIER